VRRSGNICRSGDGGLGEAAVMLVVVLATNLLLENFVEPKAMGRTLGIHPLVVLVVTASRGVIGGIVGRILAVPFFAIARNAIARLRSTGVAGLVADRAKPTVRHIPEMMWAPPVTHARCQRSTSRQRPIHAGLNSVGTGFTAWT
jgi:hypothetical protein